jgi:hypothetical protein
MDGSSLRNRLRICSPNVVTEDRDGEAKEQQGRNAKFRSHIIFSIGSA